jgi:hypothetical protein
MTDLYYLPAKEDLKIWLNRNTLSSDLMISKCALRVETTGQYDLPAKEDIKFWLNLIAFSSDRMNCVLEYVFALRIDTSLLLVAQI